MLAFALWSIGALIAAGYCIVRALGDLRARKYMMGVIGLGSAAIFLLTPIKTQKQPISLTLPAATTR